MADFAKRLGGGAIGVYAADKPDADISASALSAPGRALLAKARSVYTRANDAASMSIPAEAAFVGGWALFHDVLAPMSGQPTSKSLRTSALQLDVPAGDAINSGRVRLGTPGALHGGQTT